MAASGDKPVRRGSRYCVAGAPNNTSCKNTSYSPGIKMHQFPSDPKVQAEWLKFVQRHCIDFGDPVNKHAALCSAHFEPSCYSMAFGLSLEGMEESKRNKILLKGSMRHTVLPVVPEELSDRKRRQLRHDVLSEIGHGAAKKKKTCHTETTSTATVAVTTPAATTVAVVTVATNVTATEDSLDTDLAQDVPFVTSSTDTLQPIMSTPSTPSTVATPVTTDTPLSSLLTPPPLSDSGSCLQSGNCDLKEKCARLSRTNKRLKRRIKELKLQTVLC